MGTQRLGSPGLARSSIGCHTDSSLRLRRNHLGRHVLRKACRHRITNRFRGNRAADHRATNWNHLGTGCIDGGRADHVRSEGTATPNATLVCISRCRSVGCYSASDLCDLGRCDQPDVSDQRTSGGIDEAIHRSNFSAPWLTVVLLMAAVPAICEELAFRGFIFGGLVRRRRRLRAVIVTAVMFGISHGILQQSISATIMGLLLGWIALRTGSVLPGIVIHFTNNALSVSLARSRRESLGRGIDFPDFDRERATPVISRCGS